MTIQKPTRTIGPMPTGTGSAEFLDVVRAALLSWMKLQLSVHGWTAQKWAENAGIAATTVTRFMKDPNEKLPSYRTVALLARSAGSNPPFIVAASQEREPDRALTPDQKNAIDAVVRAFAEPPAKEMVAPAPAPTMWNWRTDQNHRFFLSSPPSTDLHSFGAHIFGQTRWEMAGATLDDPAWRQHKADLDDHRNVSGFSYKYLYGGFLRDCVIDDAVAIYSRSGTFEGYVGSTQVTYSRLDEGPRTPIRRENKSAR